MRLRTPAAAWIFAAAMAISSCGVAAAQVDYVRVCDAFGTGFLYVPGTDTCLNPSTGDQRTQTDKGLIRNESPLADRVRALESDFCDECFAVLGSDGSVVSSAGLRRAQKTATGTYEAVFDKPATRCAVSATLDQGKGRLLPGMIAVGASTTNDRAVLIQTYNATGVPTDRRFSLALECRPKRPIRQIFNDNG